MNIYDLKLLKNITILTKNQLIGNNKLSIFENTMCAKTTDLCKALGIDNYECYWTRTACSDNIFACVVSGQFDNKIEMRKVSSRTVGVRPVLPEEIVLEITKDILEKQNQDDKYFLFEYGEYPQQVASKTIQDELETFDSYGELEETGKKYTFDAVFCSGDYWGYKKFSPLKCKEYIYKGKKYIRVEVITGEEKIKLSNGETYISRDYAWIEVQPIKWLIDIKQKVAVSENILFAGIKFGKYSDGCYYYGDFSKTDLNEYLKKYFIRDIIPSRFKKKKQKNQSEEKQVLSEDKEIVSVNEDNKQQNQSADKEKSNEEAVDKEKSKIDILIEQIRFYLQKNPNQEEIVTRINDLIHQYNLKLEEINSKNENDILTLENVDTVTFDLELKLSMILDEVKKYYEKNIEYIKIIDYINQCMVDLLLIDKPENDKENKRNDDEFTKDLAILINDCIPFLKEEDSEKIKNKILEMFVLEIKKITQFMANDGVSNGENDIKLGYGNYDEFILKMREKLHPILEEVSDKVSKRNIELEISETLNKIIKGIFEEPKNKILALHLSEINDIYVKITDLLISLDDVKKKKYLDKLSTVLKMEIDYTKNLNEVLAQLRVMLISLNMIEYEISSYLEKKNKINSSYVNTFKL